MRPVAIVGIGIHKFGRFEKSYVQMGQEATRMALKDANVSIRDIESAYLSKMYLPATSGARILRPMGAHGLPIVDMEAACASGGVALRYPRTRRYRNG